MIIKCLICGKEFITCMSNIKKGYGKFCSRKCNGLWKSKNLKGENSHLWKPRNKQICKVCGNKFYSNPSRIKAGKGKFCSHKCYWKWLTKNSKKGNECKFWKGGKIERTCEICKNIFYVDKNVVKKGKGLFCSTKCMGEWHSQTQKGEHSCHWRGGITSITTKIRTSKKYNDWRKTVFKRDKWICNKCGYKGHDIIAHHKRRFNKMINYLKKKMPLINLYDIAMLYPPLWNVSNGVTLCYKCHKKTHGWKI